MSGQHRRGHLATPSGGAVQAVGLTAIVASILTALVVVALSVSGAVQSSASEQVGVRPAAADRVAELGRSGHRAARRHRTGGNGDTVHDRWRDQGLPPRHPGQDRRALGGPARAVPRWRSSAGVALLLLGRDLPFGRHERAFRPRHTAAF